MSRGKQLTENDFNAVKNLLLNGVPVDNVITWSNFSVSTVMRINRVNTFQEYQMITHKNKPTAVQPVEPAIDIKLHAQLNTIISKLDRLIELQESNSKADKHKYGIFG